MTIYKYMKGWYLATCENRGKIYTASGRTHLEAMMFVLSDMAVDGVLKIN